MEKRETRNANVAGPKHRITVANAIELAYLSGAVLLLLQQTSRHLYPYFYMAVRFDLNSLYLVLTDRGSASSFHWSFYLRTAATSGETLHLVNRSGMTEWEFECLARLPEDVATANELLLVLKLGDLDPVLHGTFKERLAQIPVQYSARFRESISCRVWMKEALFALDDEGFITLAQSVGKVEADAKLVAMLNRAQGRKSIVDCGGAIV